MGAHDWLLLGLGCLMIGTIGAFFMAFVFRSYHEVKADHKVDIAVAREAMNNVIRAAADDDDPEHDEQWRTAVNRAIGFYRTKLR